MSHEGQPVEVLPLDDGLVELQFELKDDSVNKLNQATIASLEQAIASLPKPPALRGVLVRSGKDVFIVGADVTEFVEHFEKTEEELTLAPFDRRDSLGTRGPRRALGRGDQRDRARRRFRGGRLSLLGSLWEGGRIEEFSRTLTSSPAPSRS